MEDKARIKTKVKILIKPSTKAPQEDIHLLIVIKLSIKALQYILRGSTPCHVLTGSFNLAFKT